jgi:hypothetical protein
LKLRPAGHFILFRSSSYLHNMYRIKIFFLGFISCLLFACRQGKVSPAITAEVEDSVRAMSESIVKDLAAQGPSAWLRYFEQDSGFFMASEGQLVFPNYDSAAQFINHVLVNQIRKIELRWSYLHVTPVAPGFAFMAARFHEVLTDSSEKQIGENGYFTGLVHHNEQGWQLRNAHWSVVDTR